MKGFERRLLKLEKSMKGRCRSLKLLSDEELEFRIAAMLKRVHGEELSPRETAALGVRPQPTAEFSSMTNEELSSRLRRELAKWLDGNTNRRSAS